MFNRSFVSIVLFAALMVVLSMVPPVPIAGMSVPITLQALGVMLAGCILGARNGALAVLLYLLMAAAGLPVLPGGRGGLGVFAGPTGGFLIGMFFGAAVCGWLGTLLTRRARGPAGVMGAYLAAALTGGMGVVFLFGIPWLAAETGMGLHKATLAMGVFVPGGVLKAVVAAVIAYRVQRVWPAAGLRRAP